MRPGCGTKGTWERLRPLTQLPMPTVFRHGPYRFYFYSHDVAEPAHVHVDRDALSAKLWLEPVSVAVNLGFAPAELRRVTRLVKANRRRLLEAWRDYFEF